MSLLASLSVLLPILLSVAFITLIERKWLAATQRRVGPNAVGLWGLLQPFADALKLLAKECVVPSHASKVLFYVSPVITLVFSLLGWTVVPFSSGSELLESNLSILLSLALSSLGIYGVLLAGWSANSKYALLGSLRSTAQIVSYELIYGSSVLCVVLIHGSFNYNDVVDQQTLWTIIPLLPVGFIYWVSALAETNRAPIDLPEAESELVAGFFTEHSSVPFVIFFLAEYGSLVLMSAITSLLFLGGYPVIINPLLAGTILGLKTTFVCLCFVWVRATLPRLRYDTLIELCWTDLLPAAIAFVLLVPSILVAFEAY